MLPWQLGHPLELPSPSPDPFSAALKQMSEYTMDQESVSMDYWPSVSLLQCDCNSPVDISHKILCYSLCLNSAFTYSFYCSPPSYRGMIPLEAVFGSTARPTDQHPHHQHSAKPGYGPCPHHTLPARAGLRLLPCSHTLAQKGQTKGLYLAVAIHLLIYTIFL